MQMILHLMQASTAKAESQGFSTEAARVYVLRYLTEHGPSWSEDIVESAGNQGRPELRGHDGRCWGSVFKVLSGRHQIRCLRSDGIRRNGNGTSGAKQWTRF